LAAFEGFGARGPPEVVAVFIGPDDLGEGEGLAVVVPAGVAGVADVVEVLVLADFDEADRISVEQIVAGGGEIEAAVLFEADGDGVQDALGGLDMIHAWRIKSALVRADRFAGKSAIASG
jgi:hypothetical protein